MPDDSLFFTPASDPTEPVSPWLLSLYWNRSGSKWIWSVSRSRTVDARAACTSDRWAFSFSASAWRRSPAFRRRPWAIARKSLRVPWVFGAVGAGASGPVFVRASGASGFGGLLPAAARAFLLRAFAVGFGVGTGVTPRMVNWVSMVRPVSLGALIPERIARFSDRRKFVR